jgi:hypothetical protein
LKGENDMDNGYHRETIDKIDQIVGFEGNILELSKELQRLGAEDVYYFDNWGDIIDEGNFIADFDDRGDIHADVYFDVVHHSGHNELIKETIIAVTDVRIV